MHTQKTITHEIPCKSVGLHSGRKVNMIIKPAPVDTGIVFCRKDQPESALIKAEFTNVSDTTLATTLESNGVKVSTVEHLLSAFYGIGIDNALIEIDSFEIPIMDGSSLPFVNMIKKSGIKIQNKSKKFIVIDKPVSVCDEHGKAMLLPSPEFKITYHIDFKHPAVGNQSYHMIFSHEAYEKDICAARTFGFLRDVEYLQAQGLALGGSLNNAVVLDEEKIINKTGLRFNDEFVKHKILDAIGDLSLFGMPIIGHFIAYKSGHKLNNLLLRKLSNQRKCWKTVHHFEEEMLKKVSNI